MVTSYNIKKLPPAGISERWNRIFNIYSKTGDGYPGKILGLPEKYHHFKIEYDEEVEGLVITEYILFGILRKKTTMSLFHNCRFDGLLAPTKEALNLIEDLF